VPGSGRARAIRPAHRSHDEPDSGLRCVGYHRHVGDRSGPGIARGDAARLRGASAGLVSGSLSVAAHGWASGGAAPDGSAIMLLAAAAAITGALVADLAPLRSGRVGLVAALVAGQLLGHLGMSLGASHQQHENAHLTAGMLTGHLVAALFSAVIIRGAEFAYRVSTATLARIVVICTRPQPVADPAPLLSTHVDRAILRIFAANIASSRAPPLS